MPARSGLIQKPGRQPGHVPWSVSMITEPEPPSRQRCGTPFFTPAFGQPADMDNRAQMCGSMIVACIPSRQAVPIQESR